MKAIFKKLRNWPIFYVKTLIPGKAGYKINKKRKKKEIFFSFPHKIKINNFMLSKLFFDSHENQF